MSRRPSQGELRQSQVLTTYGPGCMVDLPEHAAIVGGLEHWRGEMEPVIEDRLAREVKRRLGLPAVRLQAPPADVGEPGSGRSGITAFTFPEWFLAQWERTRGATRSRPLVHWKDLEKRRWRPPGERPVPVVPVRFVQACIRGHIGDIDWYGYAHEDPRTSCRKQLWLDEGGTTGDLAEIAVRCEACGARRPLSQAKLPGSRVLGPCRGRRPWLGHVPDEACLADGGGPEYARLLVRSASNAWFGQTVTVISIPEREEKVRQAVAAVWDDFLQYSESADDLRRERRRARVASALEGLEDDEVWREVQRRRAGSSAETRPVKQAEIETLRASREVPGDDRTDGDFSAASRSLEGLPERLSSLVERIVLVHRLREVTALIGFTRFEAVMPELDDALDLRVRRAAIAQDVSWVPAVENRGEGVFLSFREDAVAAWLERPQVQARGRRLLAAFERWRSARGLEVAPFPGLPYVMLHSLAHLLITAVALECGYGAASIRERVYAGPGGFGILLYTGAPGVEGTVGGLVDVGRRIERHIERALEAGRLCSNDPVCAQHDPEDPREERFLHGSACHGCLLIAEPSCEHRNEFLDRALVVPTVAALGAEFFQEPRSP